MLNENVILGLSNSFGQSYGCATKTYELMDEYENVMIMYGNFYGPNFFEFSSQEDIQKFIDFESSIFTSYKLPFRKDFAKQSKNIITEFFKWFPSNHREYDLSSEGQYTSNRFLTGAMPDDRIDRFFEKLDKVNDPQLKLALEIALGTGYPLDHITKINLKDIDLEKGRIRDRSNNVSWKYRAIGPQLRIDLHQYICDLKVETYEKAPLFKGQEQRRHDENDLKDKLRDFCRIIDKPRPLPLDYDMRLYFTYVAHFMRYGGEVQSGNDNHIRTEADGETPDEVRPPHPRLKPLMSLNRFYYYRENPPQIKLW